MRGEHCLCHKTLFTGSPQKSEIRALLSYHQTKIVHVMLNFPSFFSRLNEFKPEKFEVKIKNDTHGQREQPTFGGVSRAPPEASQNGRRGDGGRAAEDGQAVGRHGGGPRLPRPSPAGALPAPRSAPHRHLSIYSRHRKSPAVFAALSALTLDSTWRLNPASF
jgi:hypothetical protein